MIKTNFHTHTDFCDGKNTPEEMVLSAIEKGIQILGFSGHSLYPFSDDWHIPSLKHNEYCKEILSLKEKYADKIQILLGFETDFVPGVDCFSALKKDFKPDYQIGSVHFIFKEAGFFTVDGSVQECLNGIEKVFANDKKAAVCEYFALQRQMLKKGGFELWGHPDLVQKFNSKLHWFDPQDSWYKNELKACVELAAKSSVVAEVNTGGMARGYTKEPYPALPFLTMLKEAGVPVTISSDCHNSSQIDFGFDIALKQIKKAGYKEIAYLAASSTIKMQKID